MLLEFWSNVGDQAASGDVMRMGSADVADSAVGRMQKVEEEIGGEAADLTEAAGAKSALRLENLACRVGSRTSVQSGC